MCFIHRVQVWYRTLRGFPEPVLYEWDVFEIAVDSGHQVRARIRVHRGEKKLVLEAPSECSEAVVQAARQQALDFLQFNFENPEYCKRYKCKYDGYDDDD